MFAACMVFDKMLHARIVTLAQPKHVGVGLVILLYADKLTLEVSNLSHDPKNSYMLHDIKTTKNSMCSCDFE
jgi:hypothetical protein